nr:FecR family protein [Pedobacter sp. ASV19]
MKTLELTDLFNRYLQNTCSEEELELLMLHFHSPDVRALNELVAQELDKNDLGSASQEQDLKVSIDRVYQNLRNRISDQVIDHQKTVRRLWSPIAAAAAVLLIVGLGIIFYISYYSPRRADGRDSTKDLVNDIMPGGNKAYLTLANGQKLSLTDVANGTLAKESGVEISKTADGQVIYTLQHAEGGMTATNTIETPNGGQYQVCLPDGSKVWLNAASKLIYPVSFATQKERRVTLSGEAYFEIAKDKQHPFHVKTANQEIEVLGTHFNVNGYSDEGSIRTTLLEGSVRILAGNGSGMQRRDAYGVVLKPGQQSILAAGKINVTEVDAEEAVAWKQGVFNFHNEDIFSLMRKLARWYNIEVIYEGSVPDVRFGAEISRSRSLAQVLKILEKTEGVKFKIEGRRVTVMP